MKNLFMIMVFSSMIISCVSNGKQSREENVSREDSVVLETPDSNVVAYIDTIDTATYLDKMESILNDMKQIQIKKAEDTLQFERLKERYGSFNLFNVPDKNEIKHSVRVRILKVTNDYLSEIIRLSKESKAAGINDNEDNEKEFEKAQKIFERQLWLETH